MHPRLPAPAAHARKTPQLPDRPRDRSMSIRMPSILVKNGMSFRRSLVGMRISARVSDIIALGIRFSGRVAGRRGKDKGGTARKVRRF